MSLRFSKGHVYIMIVSIVCIILAVVYMDFGVFAPMRLARDGLKQELKMYTAISKGNAKEVAASAAPDNTAALQTMVPVEPLVEQYVLDLEKVEGLSGVSIQSIGVQVGESPMVNISGNGAATGNGQAQGQETATGTTLANPTGATQANTQLKSQGAAAIVWNIQVQYMVYEQLQAFLKAAEELPRITTVSSLQFKGKSVSIAAGGQGTETATVVLTTYYVPNVKQADEQTPNVDLPPLCTNRTNPTEPQKCK